MNGFEGLNSLIPLEGEEDPAAENASIWENLMSVILESEMGAIDTEADLSDSLNSILRRQV